MRRLIAAVLAGAACTWCAAAVDVVLLRGGEPPLEGEVTLSEAGVTVRTGTGSDATLEVPWDRVRDVRMLKEPADLDRYLARAEDLWRARSRLERGDAAMAEPLFERLFADYRGRTSETALVVAEGLLRCRLERHDLSRAVVPALEVARLRRADVTTASYGELAVVYDEETGLCVGVPPVWLDEASAQQLAGQLGRYDARGDAVVAALRRLYLASASPGEAEVEVDRETRRHPGVRLMMDLVETNSRDEGRRDAARGRLLRDMRRLPDWAEGGARYCVGHSLVQEQDPARAELGALQLSHLPARYAQQQPYLAGLALRELIEFAQLGGNVAAAGSLRQEFARRYAFHPVRRFVQ